MPRARGRWRRPDSQLECQWLALMHRERQKRNLGSSRPSASQAPHFAATSLALPSLLLEEKSGLHPLQEKCHWLQEEQRLLKHCHWGCSLPSIPSTCTAESQQGRGTVRSRAEATVRIPQDQVFLSIRGLGSPGQGWGVLCLKVVRKPSWSSRGVTRVGIEAATGNCNHLLDKQPSAATGISRMSMGGKFGAAPWSK